MTVAARPRARWGALSLVGAGVAFLLYPAVRPYSDEKSMAGADAMASSAWLAAHLFAVAGFILFTLGLLALHLWLDRAFGSALDRVLMLRAVVVAWIGTGLTLPYYGAEVFGLNVIARQAVREQNASLLALADEFRFGPAAVTMFAAGLALLAVGGVLAAVAVWRSTVLSPWSGIPLAAGFVLFLPQFFGSPAIRVAHGALIAIGGVWLGLALWQASSKLDRTNM